MRNRIKLFTEASSTTVCLPNSLVQQLPRGGSWPTCRCSSAPWEGRAGGCGARVGGRHPCDGGLLGGTSGHGARIGGVCIRGEGDGVGVLDFGGDRPSGGRCARGAVGHNSLHACRRCARIFVIKRKLRQHTVASTE